MPLPSPSKKPLAAACRALLLVVVSCDVHAADFGFVPPRPAPKAGLPPAGRDADLRQAYAAYESGHASAAYSAYLRAARRGQPIGQYNLAMMKFNGEGTKEDVAGSVRWLRKAAEAGFALAQYNLALLYENGNGVERSQTAASHWFLDAAEQGHVDAQLAIATQLLLGRGVPQDLAGAIHWYEQAAIAGNADAQYSLASFYEHGEGVVQDEGKALAWYAAAARQGDRAALEKVRVLADAGAARR